MTVKKFAIALGSLALSLPLAAQAQGSVVASAGKASVTQADMTNLLKGLPAQTRTRLAADPAGLDQVVRARLASSAVLAEAQAKGWDKQPQVQQMIDASRREVILRSYLASVSAPPAGYPSDADIQTAYQNNQAAFTMPRAVHVAQIFIAAPQSGDAATLEKARRQAADLAHQAHASGADFAALARANSQEKASAANGGDMGFVPVTMMVPEIRTATDKMKPGDVSAPIQTAAGFHIIKLIDTRAAGVAPFADVKERIRLQLREQREQQNAQAYMAKLAGPDAAKINEDALRQALAAAQ